jgi:site-specific DNA-cytosine methylase
MGLLFKKNKTYVDKIINKLTECGYKVSLQKLFSEDFGVPQKRPVIFAPQKRVQGAEASKISKLNNSFGMSSLLKKSLISSQKAYFGFKLSLYSINLAFETKEKAKLFLKEKIDLITDLSKAKII